MQVNFKGLMMQADIQATSEKESMDFLDKVNELLQTEFPNECPQLFVKGVEVEMGLDVEFEGSDFHICLRKNDIGYSVTMDDCYVGDISFDLWVDEFGQYIDSDSINPEDVYEFIHDKLEL